MNRRVQNIVEENRIESNSIESCREDQNPTVQKGIEENGI